MPKCESSSKASATSHNMPLRVNLDYLTYSLLPTPHSLKTLKERTSKVITSAIPPKPLERKGRAEGTYGDVVVVIVVIGIENYNHPRSEANVVCQLETVECL